MHIPESVTPALQDRVLHKKTQVLGAWWQCQGSSKELGGVFDFSDLPFLLAPLSVPPASMVGICESYPWQK